MAPALCSGLVMCVHTKDEIMTKKLYKYTDGFAVAVATDLEFATAMWDSARFCEYGDLQEYMDMFAVRCDRLTSAGKPQFQNVYVDVSSPEAFVTSLVAGGLLIVSVLN